MLAGRSELVPDGEPVLRGAAGRAGLGRSELAAGRAELTGRPELTGRSELPGRSELAGRLVPLLTGRPLLAGRLVLAGRPAPDGLVALAAGAGGVAALMNAPLVASAGSGASAASGEAEALAAFRAAERSALAAVCSLLAVALSARASLRSLLASIFRLCGPITMIMFRPSCFGWASTKPSSSTSPARRCSSLKPSSGRDCSRPLNMIVTLTLSPALRNRSTWPFLVP